MTSEHQYACIAEMAYKEPGASDAETCAIWSSATDISGLHHVYFFDAKKKGDGTSDAQVYTLICEDRIIFACRGTESLSDIATDISIWKEPFQDLIYCNSVDTAIYKNIKVHSGFLDQYNTIKYSMMATLYSAFWSGTAADRKVVFVGHSLGGALASLGAACAKAHFGSKICVECYTYGSPRVGNRDFVRYFDATVNVSVRHVNGSDLITRIPKLFFYHVKGEKKIGAAKKCLASAEDHFMKNYKKVLGC